MDSGTLKMKWKVYRGRVKETKWKREDSGWRVKGEVGVYATVSKPQEQQRKAVNGSSPCLNRLWTVLQSTANHRSSWRLLWVRALTRCLQPDQGDDTVRGEWKRQKGGGRKKKQRDEVVLVWRGKKVGLQAHGCGFFILVTLKFLVTRSTLEGMYTECLLLHLPGPYLPACRSSVFP